MSDDTTLRMPTLPDVTRYARTGSLFVPLPLESITPTPAEVDSNLDLLRGTVRSSAKAFSSLRDIAYQVPHQYENGMFFHDIPFHFNAKTGLMEKLNDPCSSRGGYVVAQLVFYHNSALQRPQAESTDLELKILDGADSGIVQAVVLPNSGFRTHTRASAEAEYGEALGVLATTFTLYNDQTARDVRGLREAIEQGRQSR
ncbi:hypothetical protein HYV86_05075 [Candidatus Woesearchaeota archaeon]|nr:hypothetical protein [Candidatus Woesearchaeota archaeon]